MNAWIFRIWCVALCLVTSNLSGQGFEPVTAEFFCDPAIVGEDPLVPGYAAQIGFDLQPDGTPIETPSSVPGSTTLFSGSPIATTFESVGVLFQADDTPFSQPANPSGIGAMSFPNTLGGQPSVLSSDVEIDFIDPVAAAGFWVIDGPTNDTMAMFYDETDTLIATVLPTGIVAFLGIRSDTPIASIVITSTATDDYYVEDLKFMVPGTTPDFDRGDCNADAGCDIADPIYLLSHLFVSGSPLPPCDDACDSNDDGALDIADAVFKLSFLFVTGSPPLPDPTGGCGADPTHDCLTCALPVCP